MVKIRYQHNASFLARGANQLLPYHSLVVLGILFEILLVEVLSFILRKLWTMHNVELYVIIQGQRGATQASHSSLSIKRL